MNAVCGLTSWKGHNRQLALTSGLICGSEMRLCQRAPPKWTAFGGTYSGLAAEHRLESVESVDHLIHTLLKPNHSQSQLFVNADWIFLRVRAVSAPARATATRVDRDVVVRWKKTCFWMSRGISGRINRLSAEIPLILRFLLEAGVLLADWFDADIWALGLEPPPRTDTMSSMANSLPFRSTIGMSPLYRQRLYLAFDKYS